MCIRNLEIVVVNEEEHRKRGDGRWKLVSTSQIAGLLFGGWSDHEGCIMNVC